MRYSRLVENRVIYAMAIIIVAIVVGAAAYLFFPW
jgi:hypothetical protein